MYVSLLHFFTFHSSYLHLLQKLLIFLLLTQNFHCFFIGISSPHFSISRPLSICSVAFSINPHPSPSSSFFSISSTTLFLSCSHRLHPTTPIISFTIAFSFSSFLVLWKTYVYSKSLCNRLSASLNFIPLAHRYFYSIPLLVLCALFHICPHSFCTLRTLSVVTIYSHIIQTSKQYKVSHISNV